VSTEQRIPVDLTIVDDLLSGSNPRRRIAWAAPGDTLRTLVDRVLEESAVPRTGPWERPSILAGGTPLSYGDLVAEEWPLDRMMRRGSGGWLELRIGPARPGDPGTIFLTFVALITAAASAALSSRAARVRPLTTADAPSRRPAFGRYSHDAVAGDPIPVVFGRKRRWGGKLVSRTPGEGEDGNARVKLLVCLGHGPVAAIGSQTADFDRLAGEGLSGIFLNDQPIANFPGVLVSGRMGAAGQTAMPGFADTEVLREVGVGGVALPNTDGADRTGPDASAEAFTFTTLDPVNAVVLRVRFAAGLYQLSDAGQVNTRAVAYRVRTRTSDTGGGAGSWSAWTVVSLERAEQSEWFSARRLDALAAGAGDVLDVQVERATAEPADASVVDSMIFDSLVEVRYGTGGGNTYDGLAMLGIEISATEQLSTVPAVSVDDKGYAALRIWDGVSDPADPEFTLGWSDNPADIALELLTNTTFGWGAAYGDDRVDFPSLLAWREYCAEQVARPGGGTRPRFACHLAMAEQRDAIDWLRTVCSAGDCVPSPVGRTWKFVVDRAQASPVERFGDGDIAVDDRGDMLMEYQRETTTGGRVRPNRLVAQFDNEQQEDRTDVIAYPEYGQLWLGGGDAEPVLEEARRYEGVTDPDQVLARLIKEMKQIRGLSRTVGFVTTKQVPVVTPGDRFDLACSVPGWGMASGRVLGGSTPTSVRIDRRVTFAPLGVYRIKISRLDNSLVVAGLDVPAEGATYEPGEEIPLGGSPLTSAPEEGASYSLGVQGIEDKPFTCTRVSLEDPAQQRWRIEGIEYSAEVYDPDDLEVDLPTYTTLGGLFTPPGPVLSLRAFERLLQVVDGGGRLRQVVLSWRQLPADAEITATFRIYRRIVGTLTWVLVSAPSVTRTGTVLELADLDTAYDFCVVAVSVAGSALSPYDPRVPTTGIVFGLSAPPPPPPENLAITQVAGNTYTLTWDAVDGAAGYQVLTGGDTTGLPNVGAEDCLVLARTTETELAGLELPPGQPCRFFVRSAASSGRLSWTAATVAIADPAEPPGETIKHTEVFDLSADGTLTNLAWNATTSRLELVSAAADGVWESGEIDTGAATLGELTLRPETANDADDPALNTDPFGVPSIAADQWGVVSGSGTTAVVGMLMPPWPDDEQTWLFEVRTYDGATWTDYAELGVFDSVGGTIEKFQVKATLRRKTAPYRPALRGVTVVVTD
jgi:hypothetical protein